MKQFCGLPWFVLETKLVCMATITCSAGHGHVVPELSRYLTDLVVQNGGLVDGAPRYGGHLNIVGDALKYAGSAPLAHVLDNAELKKDVLQAFRSKLGYKALWGLFSQEISASH